MACRLLSETLRITDPQATQFYPQAQAWLDASGSELLGTKSLLRMLAALGPSGLAAETELLGVRIWHLLHGCLAALHQGVALSDRPLCKDHICVPQDHNYSILPPGAR